MEKSPLSKLPAELRNYISELAMSFDKPFSVIWRHSQTRLRGQSSTARLKPLALLSTCKQLRSETSELFYSLDAVEITCYRPHDQSLDVPVKHFLEHVGRERAAQLKSLIIGFRPRSTSDCSDIGKAVKDLKHINKLVPGLPLRVQAKCVHQRDRWNAHWEVIYIDIDMRDLPASCQRALDLVDCLSIAKASTHGQDEFGSLRLVLRACKAISVARI